MVGYESSRVLTTSADYFKRRALFFFRITANFDSVCLISRASRLTMQQIHCRPMLFFFFFFTAVRSKYYNKMDGYCTFSWRTGFLGRVHQLQVKYSAAINMQWFSPELTTYSHRTPSPFVLRQAS